MVVNCLHITQLVKVFGVMKSDQQLFYNGRELKDSRLTLAQYCIPSESLLYLLVSSHLYTYSVCVGIL